MILEATKATCSTSHKPRVGHIIVRPHAGFSNIPQFDLLEQVQVLELSGTIYVILAIIKFQRRFKDYMPGRNAMPKLIAFKLFVLVTTLQRVSLGFIPLLSIFRD